MSEWVDAAVVTFGRDLGFPRLALPEHGAIELTFERRGTLVLERAEGDVLIYLTRSSDHLDPDRLKRALRACHWRHGRDPVIRMGIRENRLVCLSRLSEREVTAAALARTFDQLVSVMDQVERG